VRQVIMATIRADALEPALLHNRHPAGRNSTV